MSRVDTFLELVVKQKGSDLHLISGNPPRVRLNGDTYPVKYRELSTDETNDMLYAELRKRYEVVIEGPAESPPETGVGD